MVRAILESTMRNGAYLLQEILRMLRIFKKQLRILCAVVPMPNQFCSLIVTMVTAVIVIDRAVQYCIHIVVIFNLYVISLMLRR